jgi:hypothetical protein
MDDLKQDTKEAMEGLKLDTKEDFRVVFDKLDKLNREKRL